MQRKNVLVYRHIPADQLARIKQEHDVVEADLSDPAQKDAFLAALPAAQGMIGVTEPITEDMLRRAPHLEVISSVSVGVDAYPLAALHQRGITLCHTPDVLNDAVAELVIGMMIATSRRVCEMAAMVRDGQWREQVTAKQLGWDVCGKTLGIVGYGRIGQVIARRASLGLDMPVLYHSRHPIDSGLPAGKARQVPLAELLGASDFVVLMVPLSAQTRGMFGPEAFARMKEGAILINGARGPVLQEQALLDALSGGRLRAAGLDVFDVEPLPLDSPLRGHPKVLALPHIGSATHETRHAMVERAVSNLLLVLRGEPALSEYPTAPRH